MTIPSRSPYVPSDLECPEEGCEGILEYTPGHAANHWDEAEQDEVYCSECEASFIPEEFLVHYEGD